MKQFWIIAVSIFFPAIIHAQVFGSLNKNELAFSQRQNSFCSKQLIIMVSAKSFRLFTNDSPLVKKKHDIYGDLTNDDTIYNRKYPLWAPALRVVGINALIWSTDKFILKEAFADISPATWTFNIKYGWEWDKDRFGMNFIAHPYSGTLYYNAARSNGYTYFQSIPFVIGGSLMWEYFGENTQPSYNDIINTSVNGVFLGEIFYRLSTDILDDRTRGAERIFREIGAAIVSPSAAFNRLMQGKTWRTTHKEVYQKEPCNISLFAGIHKINTEKEFLEGTNNDMLNLQIDYGNPFEERLRKPFDVFKIRVDLSYGVGRKLVDNIAGYGNLFTRNHKLLVKLIC